jgi:hypothetical protein
MVMLGDKAMAVALQREQGDTLDAIGEQFGISHQRVAQVVKHLTEVITDIELELMVARKVGRPYFLPILYGENYTLQLAFADLIVRKLRARDLELSVETVHGVNGLGLLIRDITDYSGGSR